MEPNDEYLQRMTDQAGRLVKQMRDEALYNPAGGVSLSYDEAGQVQATTPTTPDPQEEARSLLRQIVIRNGPAGAATADALRQLGFSDDEIAAMHAERGDYIRKRWPSQLSSDIVAYAVEHALSNDDIAGALYMAATKKRSHQAHTQASRNWRPPSTGQKRSLKSKRR